MEQNEQMHAAMGHRPCSWEMLPQPEPGVRHLLLAEAAAAQLLPYQLLDLESPSLPLIYVRQHLRGWFTRPQATGEPGDLAGDMAQEDVRPAAEALPADVRCPRHRRTRSARRPLSRNWPGDLRASGFGRTRRAIPDRATGSPAADTRPGTH